MARKEWSAEGAQKAMTAAIAAAAAAKVAAPVRLLTAVPETVVEEMVDWTPTKVVA